MLEELYQLFLKHRVITTDSRQVVPGCLYFALKGDRFNGNAFALSAIEQGAACAVVDEDISSQDPRVIRVDHVLSTLQALAYRYRRDWTFPVLAITGSNGKTTTKELIRDVLRCKYEVSATKGNLNNHIGIPLTMLSVPATCNFAVIEMGANHQQEIAGYCQYAQPTHGLITNIGKAHLEGFGGEEGVFKGKKELYDFLHAHGAILFANTELEKLKRATQGMDPIEYGFNGKAFQLRILSESPTLTFEYTSPTMQREIVTQLAGGYNLYNIASAIQIGLTFGVMEKEILEAIQSYVPDNNRSQLKQTDRNTLIMDAYNANPTSVEHALRSLAQQKNPHKMFILGDMLELGDASEREHDAIILLTEQLGLTGYFVGPIFSSICHQRGIQSFPDTAAARVFFSEQLISDFLILLKGSRGIQLEAVMDCL
jgi:UDP-N-acetylmuramoyl-tripeptide--D-alanyl-D-alanine ligase